MADQIDMATVFKPGQTMTLEELHQAMLKVSEPQPEVQKLRQKVNKYKSFFSDMVSEDNPLDYDNILLLVSEHGYSDHSGRYNHTLYSIEMDQHTLKHRPDIVLLHELIHLHVDRLTEEEKTRCQEQLKKTLAGQIPDLDYLLEGSAEDMKKLIPADQLKGHGRLFLLKSLDIDLKKHYKLGKTFDYGLEYVIADLIWKKDHTDYS